MMMHVMRMLPVYIFRLPAKNSTGRSIAEDNFTVTIQSINSITCRIENNLVL
jgi:hypothetical protein